MRCARGTYPRNFAPTGPNSRMRLANASPSIRGGGFVNLSLLRYLHVTRIGIAALRGGTITRTPLCLHPRIAPPLASTRKETRKLRRFWGCVTLGLTTHRRGIVRNITKNCNKKIAIKKIESYMWRLLIQEMHSQGLSYVPKIRVSSTFRQTRA